MYLADKKKHKMKNKYKCLKRPLCSCVCFLLGHGAVFQLILFKEAIGVFLVLSLCPCR